MAYRIHVVAVQDTTQTLFRKALDGTEEDGNGSRRFRMGSSGRWHWANASVWHVSGAAIDVALETLAVPSLRVTSSDAVLWMLTLNHPQKPVFCGVHYFDCVGGTYVAQDELSLPEEDDNPDWSDEDEDVSNEVAGISRDDPATQFLWDESEAELIQRMLEEEAATECPELKAYTDYGVTLPHDIVAQMRKQNDDLAAFTAFHAHGPQIIDALEEYGIEVDREELLTLPLNGPLTELESDSDIGNMLRFLSSLGIEGVFESGDETGGESNRTHKRDDAAGTELHHEDLMDKTVDSESVNDQTSDAEPDFVAKLMEMAGALENARAVPHSQVVIHRGKTGSFYQASMKDLKHVSPESLREHDNTMKSFGFRKIADMVADADQRQELTRCYAGHQQAISVLGHRNKDNQVTFVEDNDGAVLADFRKGIIEFHSHFADRSCLVTTTMDTARSKPKVRIFVRCYEGSDAPKLWARHLDGINRMVEHRETELIDHLDLQSPKKFAVQIDRLLKRFMRA